VLNNDEIGALLDLFGRTTSGYIIVREGLLRQVLSGASRDILTVLRGQSGTANTIPAADDLLVHRKVRLVREAHGITQRIIATAAGVRQPDISVFERNGPSGYAERIPRIISALESLVAPPPAP